MSLDHGLCMDVFICGGVNVRELFKRVVVYFWGLGYMCSSYNNILGFFCLFIVKLSPVHQNVNSMGAGIFPIFLLVSSVFKIVPTIVGTELRFSNE